MSYLAQISTFKALTFGSTKLLKGYFVEPCIKKIPHIPFKKKMINIKSISMVDINYKSLSYGI
jgi:hypothetical protein